MTPSALIAFRTERGWSQREAARQYGVSRGALAAWEDGERDAPEWIGYVLAAIAYGLPPYGVFASVRVR